MQSHVFQLKVVQHFSLFPSVGFLLSLPLWIYGKLHEMFSISFPHRALEVYSKQMIQGHFRPLFHTIFSTITISFTPIELNWKTNHPVGCFSSTRFSLWIYRPLFRKIWQCAKRVQHYIKCIVIYGHWSEQGQTIGHLFNVYIGIMMICTVLGWSKLEHFCWKWFLFSNLKVFTSYLNFRTPIEIVVWNTMILSCQIILYIFNQFLFIQKKTNCFKLDSSKNYLFY